MARLKLYSGQARHRAAIVLNSTSLVKRSYQQIVVIISMIIIIIIKISPLRGNHAAARACWARVAAAPRLELSGDVSTMF